MAWENETATATSSNVFVIPKIKIITTTDYWCTLIRSILLILCAILIDDFKIGLLVFSHCFCRMLSVMVTKDIIGPKHKLNKYRGSIYKGGKNEGLN